MIRTMVIDTLIPKEERDTVYDNLVQAVASEKRWDTCFLNLREWVCAVMGIEDDPNADMTGNTFKMFMVEHLEVYLIPPEWIKPDGDELFYQIVKGYMLKGENEPLVEGWIAKIKPKVKYVSVSREVANQTLGRISPKGKTRSSEGVPRHDPGHSDGVRDDTAGSRGFDPSD